MESCDWSMLGVSDNKNMLNSDMSEYDFKNIFTFWNGPNI